MVAAVTDVSNETGGVFISAGQQLLRVTSQGEVTPMAGGGVIRVSTPTGPRAVLPAGMAFAGVNQLCVSSAAEGLSQGPPLAVAVGPVADTSGSGTGDFEAGQPQARADNTDAVDSDVDVDVASSPRRASYLRCDIS